MPSFDASAGKLKKLLDRLSAARALLLDNLDVAISTRAAASSALLRTTWTNDRATKLDNLDALVSSVKPLVPKFQLFTSDGTWTRPAGVDNVFVTAIGGGQGGNRQSTTSTTTGGSSGESGYRVPFAVAGNITVQRGDGGARRTGSNGVGTAGQDSLFGSLTFRGGDSASSIGVLGAEDNAGKHTGTPSSPYSQGAKYTDASSTAIGGPGLVYNGVEYGNGGRGDTLSDANSTDGANGFVLVEWWETA